MFFAGLSLEIAIARRSVIGIHVFAKHSGTSNPFSNNPFRLRNKYPIKNIDRKYKLHCLLVRRMGSIKKLDLENYKNLVIKFLNRGSNFLIAIKNSNRDQKKLIGGCLGDGVPRLPVAPASAQGLAPAQACKIP